MKRRRTATGGLGELLYRGSVKDVWSMGDGSRCVFVFSDRYSIFDWGEMPDLLPHKGESLAMMGDALFRFLGDPGAWKSWKLPVALPPEWRRRLDGCADLRRLREMGLRHHSFGLVDESGSPLKPGDRSNRLLVKSWKRILPRREKQAYDYADYSGSPTGVLVPLEVVFRLGAPEGSSFLGRAQADGVKAGDRFPVPVVEFFTKLEPTDRFLTRKEAAETAGLSSGELERIENLTILLALRLEAVFSRLGVELWDGKFEFAFTPGEGKERSFELVDSIGPDELRLVKKGVHLSKEILRRHYRGSKWYAGLERAKKLAAERGEEDFRRLCEEELELSPRPLPQRVFGAVKGLYPALAAGILQETMKVHLRAPALEKVCARLETLP
ncbi:MAG: hypothetical protein HUU37_05765 [Bdellovibrionales bacterium]|nr:hypothetical protein [Bdellovibrionales bacterium]